MRPEEMLVSLLGRLFELIRERSSVQEDFDSLLQGLQDLTAERSFTLRVEGKEMTVDGTHMEGESPPVELVGTLLNAHGISEVRFAHRVAAPDVLMLAKVVALDLTAYPRGHDATTEIRNVGASTVTVLSHAQDATAEQRRATSITDALVAAGLIEAGSASRPSVEAKPGAPRTSQRELDAKEKALSEMLEGGRIQEAIDGVATLVRDEAAAKDPDLRRAYGGVCRRLLTGANIKRFAPLLLDQLYAADVRTIVRRAGERGTVVLLELLVEAPTFAERKAYLDVLRQVEEGTKAIAGMLRHPEWYVIRNMADLAGDLRIEEAVEALGRVVEHSDDRVRRSVGVALAKIGTAAAGRHLNVLLQDPEPSVKITVFREVGGSAHQGLAMPLVLAIEREENLEVRAEFYRALGRIGTSGAIDALKKVAVRSGGLLAGRRVSTDRVAAVEGLALANSDGARNILRTLCDDRSRDVRDAAKRALGTGR